MALIIYYIVLRYGMLYNNNNISFCCSLNSLTINKINNCCL